MMSVKLRITLITAVLLLGVSIIVSIYTLRAQQAELHRESIRKVKLALSMLSEMAATPLSKGDVLALAQIADGAARGQPQRVCIADKRGVILVDSKHSLYDQTLPALREVARTGTAYVRSVDDLLEGAAPVRDYEGRLGGMVYVTFSSRQTDQASALVVHRVVIFALILTCFGTLVAYLLGSYFSSALFPLLAAIRRTSDGDYSTTVAPTGMTELDEIGQAFDKMAGLLGSEVRNLGLLNRLAGDLTGAGTLQQFGDFITAACRTLVGGNAWLLFGDPRMGAVEPAGAGGRKRPVGHNDAAFLAVNEMRPVSIGEEADLPPDSPVAEGLMFASGVVAPLITPARQAVGVLAVELAGRYRPAPGGQDETMVMAVANLAAPILATLSRSWTQQEALTALAEILLPEEVPQPEGLEVFANSTPADVSSGFGGDYYDVFQTGENVWGIAIGDVSGKGLDAGRYTAMTKYVVRSFALEHVSPAETIAHANEALSAQMGEMRFVTVFYGVVDVLRRTIVYCCAGHLPGLLYRAASDDFVELEAGGPAVGMAGFGGMSQYSQATAQLEPHDILMLYTDGILEARSGEDEYGLTRLESVVRANARRSLKNIAAAVTGDVRQFAQNLVRDDMTLVLIRLAGGVD